MRGNPKYSHFEKSIWKVSMSQSEVDLELERDSWSGYLLFDLDQGSVDNNRRPDDRTDGKSVRRALPSRLPTGTK